MLASKPLKPENPNPNIKLTASNIMHRLLTKELSTLTGVLFRLTGILRTGRITGMARMACMFRDT